MTVAEKGKDNDAVGLQVEAPAGSDIRARLASGIVERGLELRELRRMAVSLEEIFHELTTSEEESA